jgi:hypothetical protein
VATVVVVELAKGFLGSLLDIVVMDLEIDDVIRKFRIRGVVDSVSYDRGM